jgi:hypothetical protein
MSTHNTEGFLESTSGRMLAGIGSLAAAGGVVATFVSPEQAELVTAVVAMICIALAVVAVGLATERHGGVAFGLLLALPFLLGLYYAAMHLAPLAGPGTSGLLGAVSLALAARAVMPSAEVITAATPHAP